MPIKKENIKRYPKNWKEISRSIIQDRAGNRCEGCGVHNHAVGYRDSDGTFVPLGGNSTLDLIGIGTSPATGKLLDYKAAKATAEFHTFNCEYGYKYIVIVLTTAHLDHTPENCNAANLRAFCQKCHNNYDQEHRTETIRKVKSKGQLKLSI
jgi:hypothetical protein